MKHGIILSGGNGTRLRPQTSVINKHLLSVGDKFIIDYPLQSLRDLGVTHLTVVLGGSHFGQIISYFQNGNNFGFESVNFVFQQQPSGIAHAINLCKHCIPANENFAVILGDNVFENKLSFKDENVAQIMLANHQSLTRFGVASFKDDKIVKIEEKPQELDENYLNLAISGCYLFTPAFFEYFQEILPSARGEFEITDIIKKYLEDDKLTYNLVGGLWSDAGTHESIAYLNYYFYLKEHTTAEL